MLEKEITFDRFIRGLIAVAIVGLALYILNRLSNVLLPFFIAWFFAYMIYPAVKFFQYRLHLKSRLLAIVVTLLLFLGCLTGVLYLIIPPIVAEFMKFREVTGEFIRQNGGAGIAVAVEFSGPLLVAVCSSRRWTDFAGVCMAVTGMLLILPPSGRHEPCSRAGSS